MLDETISLSFSDDGVAAASAKTYKKRAHEDKTALYRENSTISDPGLPENRFLLGITEAKATKDYNGTRRASVKYRHMRTVALPLGGTGARPCCINVDISFPVGCTSADLEYDINAFAAFVNHSIFKRLAKTQET